MNKLLRYAFLAAFAVVGSFAFAQTGEVTFNFVPADNYKLFDLAGQSTGTSHDGDIIETKSATIDGVTITVTPSGAKTANRFWKSSIRLYGGSLTLKAEGKKIVNALYAINYSNWNKGNTFSPEGTVTDKQKGTYNFKNWEGEAEEVTLNVAANTQLRSIVVTYKDINAGIETLTVGANNDNAPMYNLSGQRVNKDYKGVVIRNGKKFVNS